MPALIVRFGESKARAVIPSADDRLDFSITSPLAVPIEETRFCSKCLSEQRFVADRDCAFGLVGTCQGCGEEYLRPFTRTTTAVA